MSYYSFFPQKVNLYLNFSCKIKSSLQQYFSQGKQDSVCSLNSKRRPTPDLNSFVKHSHFKHFLSLMVCGKPYCDVTATLALSMLATCGTMLLFWKRIYNRMFMLWRSSAVRTDTDRPFPGRDLRSSSRNHVSSDQSQECVCTLLSFSFSLLSSSFLYIYLRIIDVVESSTALQRRFVPDSNVVPGRSAGSVARVHQAKLPALNLRLRLIQKCC